MSTVQCRSIPPYVRMDFLYIYIYVRVSPSLSLLFPYRFVIFIIGGRAQESRIDCRVCMGQWREGKKREVDLIPANFSVALLFLMLPPPSRRTERRFDVVDVIVANKQVARRGNNSRIREWNSSLFRDRTFFSPRKLFLTRGCRNLCRRSFEQTHIFRKEDNKIRSIGYSIIRVDAKRTKTRR